MPLYQDIFYEIQNVSTNILKSKNYSENKYPWSDRHSQITLHHLKIMYILKIFTKH
jgi:hypothetical protein